MYRKLLLLVALVWLLNSAFLNDAGAQEAPVPIWHTTLDDVSSITADGGEVVSPPADFVPGAIDNAFAGNGSVYAAWYDSEVGAIFSGWDDSAGWTVDLYFQGDHWGYVIPDVMPWARKTSGLLAHDQKYRWNLRAFDEGQDGDMTHYWPRMRDMCSYAKSRGVLVGITMFTGWSKHDYSWVFHPLNVNNGGHLTNKEEAVIIASPGTEVWQEPWSDSWSDAKKTQWIWEQLGIKFINELGSMGNVFFVFFDEHSYSEGNMGDHFLNFFKSRGQIWVDWNNRRCSVAWVMSGTLHDTDKNSDAVSGFKGSPTKPYLNLEGEPYTGDHIRTAIWTFSTGGGHYFFHADAGQETVRTGIMGYDPLVPNGDKGMDKRDWLGHDFTSGHEN